MENEIGPEHRAMLNYCICRKVVSERDFQATFREVSRVSKKPYPADGIKDMLATLNATLSTLDFKIGREIDPFSYEPCYALINLCSDQNTLLATHYTPLEIQLFKKVLAAIAINQHGNYEVPMLTVLQEASKHKPPISKKVAESFIEEFVKDLWLVERNGLVSLSLRSILELEQYIRLEFPNTVTDCILCHGILVSKYYECDRCGNRVHLHCAENYFAQVGDGKCISCDSENVENPAKKLKGIHLVS